MTQEPRPTTASESEEAAFGHVCEVCGIQEVLTAADAFESGWDYPPTLGIFGIVSPRTCGTCPVTGTAWWQITMLAIPAHALGLKHLETIRRILKESDPAMG